MSNAGTLGNIVTDDFFKIICSRIKLRYILLKAGIEIPKPRKAVVLDALITIEIAWNSTRTIAPESDI
jgi:hypothetical protein